MRIAFTGAHRVGKTTLAEEVVDNLSNYNLKIEPYRELEEMGYLFSEVPTVDDFIKQFNYSLEQIENSEDDVVFDRCPLDILAYIQAVGQSDDIKPLYGKMINIMSRIDIIVVVPIELPDLIICEESALPSLRYEVDDIVQNLIGDLGNEILKVNGSIENRVKQVMDKIYS